MLKKSITYTDYNGVERSEDFFFNLTKTELTEMNLEVSGGLGGLVEKITKTQDTPKIIKLFKEIILKSYGEKSLDGRRFIKNEELTQSFVETEAYSQLFMELATNDVAASAFIKGIIPSDLAEAMDKESEQSNG